MTATRVPPATLLIAFATAALAATVGRADIVTGTVSPQDASVVILDAKGNEVAKLPAGPYQLQLPVGKYTARCLAPRQREQAILSLSDPVTVNINCG